MALNLVLGFGFVVLMTYLARTSVSWLNGLIPLFPTFALIGQASTYGAKGNAAARDVAIVGLAALVPYAAYLLAIAVLSERIGFPKAAAIGIAAWTSLAAVIVYVRHQQ
jgi:membrane protein GlpM